MTFVAPQHETLVLGRSRESGMCQFFFPIPYTYFLLLICLLLARLHIVRTLNPLLFYFTKSRLFYNPASSPVTPPSASQNRQNRQNPHLSNLGPLVSATIPTAQILNCVPCLARTSPSGLLLAVCQTTAEAKKKGGVEEEMNGGSDASSLRPALPLAAAAFVHQCPSRDSTANPQDNPFDLSYSTSTARLVNYGAPASAMDATVDATLLGVTLA